MPPPPFCTFVGGTGSNRNIGAIFILFLDQNHDLSSYQKISRVHGGFSGFETHGSLEYNHFGKSMSMLEDGRWAIGEFWSREFIGMDQIFLWGVGSEARGQLPVNTWQHLI